MFFFPARLKYQNTPVTLQLEMNLLDSEQPKQNLTNRPHLVLFATRLKIRDMLYSLFFVSWFLNVVFNSSQYA